MSPPVVSMEARPKLTKLLLNVTVQGSVGAVQVLTSPESTVGDLIAATIRQYMKEGRRPIIEADASRFDLHYSQFSLESKIMILTIFFFFSETCASEIDGACVVYRFGQRGEVNGVRIEEFFPLREESNRQGDGKRKLLNRNDVVSVIIMFE